MALVNAGAELARRGRKVLLVDFDLEAPGLSTYGLLRPEEPKQGIVEFVTQFREARGTLASRDGLHLRTGEDQEKVRQEGRQTVGDARRSR